MAVVAKKDIQTLTKQLIQEKLNILENIRQEYVVIDPEFSSERFAKEFETKINRINESQEDTLTDINPISLDELEMVVERFDSLDRILSESKGSKTSNLARNENHSMKRFGSMADVNKTLVRSQSVQSLNTTKTFNETHFQAPKLVFNQNPTSGSTSDNSDLDNVSKLTADELSKHNLMGKEIEMRLNSKQHTEKSYQTFSSDISQMYKSSFERLNKFCEEVQRIQTSKTTELSDDISLISLDHNLLDLMEKLNKALYQMRFIAENQNIYTAGIKESDSLLSDDLTDILEHFYRVIK